MLMNPPGPASLGVNRLTLTLPVGVHLGHAQEGLVQPAAVVEVEHVGLVDHGLRVGDRPEAQTAGREAADPTGLHGEGDQVEDVFLVGDRGHALGHADAEVHDRVGFEREGAAAGDGLARARREHGQPVERGPDLAGVGRVVGLGEGLRVVLGSGHHDAVDEDAGDAHLARVEHVRGGDPLHLDQDDAAGVLHRLGDGQHLDGERLAFHRHVALRVRGGPAQERDVDREGREEQVFASPDGQHLDEVLGGHRVHPAALEAGVDERVDADGGDQAGAPGGDLPEQHRDHPLREAVGLDPVAQGERAQRRYQRPVAADDPLDHALVGEVVHPARRAVALTGGEDQGQVPGCPGVQEAPLQGEGELLGKAGPDETGGGDGVPGEHQPGGRIGGDDLVPPHRRRCPSPVAADHGRTRARPTISPRSRAS